MVKKKDILKIVAYFQVYGLQIYAKKYHGYDAGKDNLESYFCGKLGWSQNRLLKTVRLLTSEGVLKREVADVDSKLYSLSLWPKTALKFIELEAVC